MKADILMKNIKIVSGGVVLANTITIAYVITY